ncbi:SET domain-containing protein [Salegentibacter chungangensis]|uniref:SET domain-containing protein n=1 Tax=Salegentibacter chungangensis TaxID=1335724 RepID=A0ABW3NM96_9FLAO
MMHPDTEIQFISKEIGYGVVATKNLPRGTITWVLDELDQAYTPSQVRNMHPAIQEVINKYSFRNNQGNFVLCWDSAKFVNHSFKSNCLSTAYDFEIAIRDIKKGEELTDDYGYLNVTEAFVPKEENTFRKVVYPNDLLNYYKNWDRELKKVFRDIETVNQPLIDLIPKTVEEKMKKVLKGEEELDSILNLYYRT